MSLHSFKLIGVDRNGNVYDREVSGHTWGGAGEKLLAHDRRFVQVLIGDIRATGNNHYKKCVAAVKGFETGKGNGVMGEALSGTGLSTAQMIISQLAHRGLTLDLVDNQEGGEMIVVSPSGQATEEEKKDISDNQDALITILREQRRSGPDAHKGRAGDLGKGYSRKQLLEKFLPQMPSTPFKAVMLAERLRGSGFTEIADDGTAMSNLMSLGCGLGMLDRVGRGVFKRSATFDEKHKPAPPPVEEVPQAPAAEPPKNPQMAQLEALFEKRPMTEPVPIDAPEAPQPPPAPTPITQPTAPAAVLPPAENLLAALAALSTTAVAGPVDMEAIAQIKTAIREFENDSYEAIVKLTNTLNPFIARMEAFGNTHARLTALLTPTKLP